MLKYILHSLSAINCPKNNANGPQSYLRLLPVKDSETLRQKYLNISVPVSSDQLVLLFDA